ncbi:DUF1569 domain-containing protein [Thalassoroseus pseudoceratinae]|uniref:DUF1569 domain-containing protein n=1 Tax=Thalassoroseus pseudoceratinae TaxID=2713176 RepID=UPI001F0D4520|nr:DUF1569 domain-containing protein [Thalassoroseus pseudoceratinae]
MGWKKSSRRTLHFDSISEIRSEINRLASANIRTIGNWSFAQILDHLASAMEASFDGFNFKSPWFVRSIAGPMVKKRFLTKPMPAGFKLPKRATQILPDKGVDRTASLSRIFAVLDRFEHEEPRQPHPVFGRLTPAESIQLHCRHAELHLSFVVPQTDAATEAAMPVESGTPDKSP